METITLPYSHKVPTPTTVMLWKSQVLDLVNEAPKPRCVECSQISHRFLSSPPAPRGSRIPSCLSQPAISVPLSIVTTTEDNSESDLSHHSLPLLSLSTPTPTSRNEKIEKLAHLIQVNLELVESLKEAELSDSAVNVTSSSSGNLDVDGGTNNAVVGRRLSYKTAAAPWHRPSIYYFNPFGKAFHGDVGPSVVKRLLGEDGDFLVRKRRDDGEDEFVLSVKFNGRVKNFSVTFDDTSGLIHLQSPNRFKKGYDTLEELVQEGLVTLYLEHKAGPYIDLLYDLTRNEYHRRQRHAPLLSTPTNGDTPTSSNNNGIYDLVDSSKRSPLHTPKSQSQSPHFERHPHATTNGNGGVSIGRAGLSLKSSYKQQSSPSPVSSSLSGSSSERPRQPDLKSHSFKTHTFQQLSKCQICHNFLWGLSSQGLLCEHCGLVIHESCQGKATTSSECEPDTSSLPSIFGVSLTILVKGTPGPGPPFLLQKCISEIDKRGLHVEGLYRISGTRDGTEKLKTMLERDRASADLSDHSDIHSMCSIVKQFLRKLPEPLISEEIFETFLLSTSSISPNTSASSSSSSSASSVSSTPNGINGSHNSHPGINVESVRRELVRLPPAHYITLKYLLQHLHRVAERSERNKMNPFNLASIFAPSLLDPKQINIQTLQVATILLELMITQVRNLFPTTK